jgi:endonuclease YncB( thermonuclease family)
MHLRLLSEQVTMRIPVGSGGLQVLDHFFRRVASFDTLAEPTAIDVPADDIVVIDGDDIEWRGRIKNARLIGFDAPELSKAKTALEWQRGLAAAARLHDLIQNAKRRQILPTADKALDRPLVRLILDGADVAKTAIEEGWAYPMAHGEHKRRNYWSKPTTPFSVPPRAVNNDGMFTELPEELTPNRGQPNIDIDHR